MKLEPQQFCDKQVRAATSLPVQCLYAAVHHELHPDSEQLLDFWTSWPSDAHCLATLFGQFYQMKQ